MTEKRKENARNKIYSKSNKEPNLLQQTSCHEQIKFTSPLPIYTRIFWFFFFFFFNKSYIRIKKYLAEEDLVGISKLAKKKAFSFFRILKVKKKKNEKEKNEKNKKKEDDDEKEYLLLIIAMTSFVYSRQSSILVLYSVYH